MDTSFGGGFVYYDIPSSGDDLYRYETGQTVSILLNGRILVGGTFRLDVFGTQGKSNVLFLLENNGEFAQDFGQQGKVFDSNFIVDSFDLDVVVLPDGKILKVGGNGARRYLSNGTLDPSFQIGTTSRSAGSEVAVRSDGRFLIVSSSAIYDNTDGRVFTADGKIVAKTRLLIGKDLAIQTDNKFLLLRSDFTLFRISAISSRGTREADFDGDEKTDISVFRRDGANPTFYTRRETGGFETVAPQSSLIYYPIPEDYTGDGRSEYAGYAIVPFGQTSFFGYRDAVTGQTRSFQWGLAGIDTPVGGDYDGDGGTDYTVFRPSTGSWYVFQSSNNQFRAVQFGQAGDLLVPADYDYDGITDFAVFRPSNGAWYVLRSSDGGFAAVQFGANGDVPSTGDFDGDGRADFVVFRPSNGVWYLLNSSEGFRAAQFGTSTDEPVPGDYDGDGRHDIAIFRGGIWYILQSRDGFRAVQWGLPTDKPVAVRY